ncbi:LapA family protein [Mycobacterium sp. 050134]
MPDSPQTPGLLLVAGAVLAFVVCVANFALGHAGAGVTSGTLALLGFGAGLAWLSMDRRRIRQAERDWVVSHPAR